MRRRVVFHLRRIMNYGLGDGIQPYPRFFLFGRRLIHIGRSRQVYESALPAHSA
jgi:hypothetical protein